MHFTVAKCCSLARRGCRLHEIVVTVFIAWQLVRNEETLSVSWFLCCFIHFLFFFWFLFEFVKKTYNLEFTL